MTTIEERVHEAIKQFEAQAVERISKESESGRDQITEWVERFLANLKVELPLSVKAVLDAGGSVRQYIITPINAPYLGNLGYLNDAQRGSQQIGFEEMRLGPTNRLRLTIIAEPMPPEKKP